MSLHAVTHPLATQPAPIRVLLVPGLHDSGPGHWQTWLQGQYEGVVRVQQSDWQRPDLAAWSERIAQTLARHDPRTEWVAVSHSFGCLALAHHLGQRQAAPATAPGALALRGSGPIRAAWMVAPASPDKFGIRQLLPRAELGLLGTLVGSETDPWMQAGEARDWAQHWGLDFINLGDAGHINAESGHGPWPMARQHVDQLIRHLLRGPRTASLAALACDRVMSGAQPARAM